MHVTRRQFAGLGLIGMAGLAVPLASCSVSDEQDQIGKVVHSSIPLPEPFGVPLPIPPILAPTHSDDGVDIYEIVQQEAQAEIISGVSTTFWGYNGIFPGPTIEARRDRAVVVRQRNELPVPVSVHLHGG